MGALTLLTSSKPNYFPKILLPNAIILGVRDSKFAVWGGYTNIQSTTNDCLLGKGREMVEVGVEPIKRCSRLARGQLVRALKCILRDLSSQQ